MAASDSNSSDEGYDGTRYGLPAYIAVRPAAFYPGTHGNEAPPRLLYKAAKAERSRAELLQANNVFIDWCIEHKFNPANYFALCGLRLSHLQRTTRDDARRAFRALMHRGEHCDPRHVFRVLTYYTMAPVELQSDLATLRSEQRLIAWDELGPRPLHFEPCGRIDADDLVNACCVLILECGTMTSIRCCVVVGGSVLNMDDVNREWVRSSLIHAMELIADLHNVSVTMLFKELLPAVAVLHTEGRFVVTPASKVMWEHLATDPLSTVAIGDLISGVAFIYANQDRITRVPEDPTAAQSELHLHSPLDSHLPIATRYGVTRNGKCWQCKCSFEAERVAEARLRYDRAVALRHPGPALIASRRAPRKQGGPVSSRKHTADAAGLDMAPGEPKRCKTLLLAADGTE